MPSDFKAAGQEVQQSSASQGFCENGGGAIRAVSAKRVAIFTTDLYRGGVAESTRKLIMLLSQHCSVDVVIYDNTPTLIEPHGAARVYQIGAPLAANFAKSRSTKLIKKILRPVGLVYALFYMVVYRFYHRPDTVFSLMYIPNLVNVLSALLGPPSKVIVSERQDPRMDLPAGSLLSRLLRWAYRRADVVHVNSPGMVSAVSEFYRIAPEKILEMDNFFYLSEITQSASAPLPEAHENLFEHPVVVSSGRLSAQKGHWHLLKAFSLVASRNPDVRLVILGDGELRGFLAREAARLGISARVHLLGEVVNPHRYVARSRVFVFPSIWESFGNALLEAMAVGVPVISTSCRSGPGDIIGWGQFGVDIGTLARLGEDGREGSRSIENLARWMEDFLNNDALHRRYSQLARARADAYDWRHADATVSQLLS